MMGKGVGSPLTIAAGAAYILRWVRQLHFLYSRNSVRYRSTYSLAQIRLQSKNHKGFVHYTLVKG